MQEDKHLKELLTKWAVEHPSADFTSNVMQHITKAYRFKTQPLLKQKVVQALVGTFILVCIALLAFCFKQPVVPLQFKVKLPEAYFSQSLSFLIAFWIVMLLNLALKRFFVPSANHHNKL